MDVRILNLSFLGYLLFEISSPVSGADLSTQEAGETPALRVGLLSDEEGRRGRSFAVVPPRVRHP